MISPITKVASKSLGTWIFIAFIRWFQRSCFGKPKIFGSKRERAIEEWRKLNIEELHNLYSCPSRAIKSRRMRLVGFTSIAQIRTIRNAKKKSQKLEYNKPSILWNYKYVLKLIKKTLVRDAAMYLIKTVSKSCSPGVGISLVLGNLTLCMERESRAVL
jgi:hypothetical protein